MESADERFTKGVYDGAVVLLVSDFRRCADLCYLSKPIAGGSLLEWPLNTGGLLLDVCSVLNASHYLHYTYHHIFIHCINHPL